MSQIARVNEVQTVADVSPMMAMIDRAARDPAVDIDKLERLMAMKERHDAQEAQREFDNAMADMQPKLPSIGERGNAAGRYTFALWEDINSVVKPILQQHGFALTFRTSFVDGVAVTGVLSHRAGHREETSITLPADGSGNKNAVQAVASSVSYGKRYTASALLNLTTHGEDDDAYKAVEESITEAQEIQLSEMLEATGSDKAKFLKFFKVSGLSELPAKKFQQAFGMLKAKETAK
jgi:hypothetical protein